MRDSTSVSRVDISSDNLHTKELYNSLTYTVKAKQQQLEDLLSELGALQHQRTLQAQDQISAQKGEVRSLHRAL
jgi:hypothetical protein